MSDEKAKPIKCVVHARQSQFDVKLPNYFFIDNVTNASKRILLSDVRLCPDYYSQMAAEHGLDSAEENDAMKTIELKATATVSPTIFKDADCHEVTVSTPEATTTTSTTLMEMFNKFVARRKPIDLLRVPVFFDWIHKSVPVYDEANISFFDDSFYTDDTAYASATHSNVLDKSVRDLPDVNNFKFPTERSVYVMQKARARMHLAPNTRVIFSNPYLMLRFGFAKSQCRIYNKQYIFENETSQWRVITGNMPFCYVDLTRGEMEEQDELLDYIPCDIRSPHKVKIELCNTDITTGPVFLEIKNKDWYKKDTALETALTTALKSLSNELNLSLKMTYLTAGKKFFFVFPDNQYISNVRLFTGAELANRMKYGLVEFLTKDSRPPDDATDSTLTYEEKARTLVYDAQIVWITLDQTSCNATLNSNEEVMCMLHPYRDGTMRSSNSDLSHTVKVPNYALGSDYISVRFNLWTFDTNGKPTPLKWNTCAIVTGLLRSKKV